MDFEPTRGAPTLSNRMMRGLRTPLMVLVTILAARAGLEFAPESIKKIEVVGKSIAVLAIAIVIWGMDRLVRIVIQEATHRGAISSSVGALLQKIARLIVFSIGILVILDSLGVSITPILASLGVGSIAVALALQDTLSNIFSAFYMLVDRPIRIGDYIKLEDGTEGQVLIIGWRSTHIRLISEDTVVMPNSKLSSSTLTNYSMPETGSIITIPIGVDYDSDLPKVRKITEDCASRVVKGNPLAVQDFAPVVRFRTFAASSIDLTVAVKVWKIADRAILIDQLIEAITTRYREENIVIPFPQTVVHIPQKTQQRA